MHYRIPCKTQKVEHIQTNAFINANWRKIIGHIENGSSSGQQTHAVFCYPEVAFTDRDHQRFSLDLIGASPSGNIYIVEIGGKRKNKQLRIYMEKLHDLFPSLSINGLVAHYNFHQSTARIAFTNGVKLRG